jgi:MFS family permease
VANFMVILDAQIVILGLPSIEAELGLSADAGQWVMSAYLLSFGGLLLLGGRSADLLGRRRMFMIGTGLFLVSSLACGLAWSGGALISARVVQGLSAAIMAPTALSILMKTFAEGAERNKALGRLVLDGGHRRDRLASDRRAAHGRAGLGVDLLDQRPGRGRAVGVQPPAPPGQPQVRR